MPATTRFVEGSLWAIAMRWAIRCTGLVSTVILARVLTPADFGIVAMSSLVMGLLLMCSEVGAAQLLLRNRETERGPYDTAWTITLIQHVVLAAGLLLLAGPAAVYFKEPRLAPVIQVVAAGSVLGGLVNIGVVMFRRDLDFRRDFLYGFYAKVLTVIPTVALALVYRSYWALVAGQIVGHALEVAISYVMHPFRPRLSLVGWRQFIRYSLWVTPANIANFLNQKVDVFVVGYLASTAQMGAYNVASELSRMATSEVVNPMARALYPNYARLKDNLEELTRSFANVVRTVAMLSFAFGFGIAAVGEDVVHLVLGEQWSFAVPLIQWLGICGAFAALLFTVSTHILIVLGRERLLFALTWGRLAILTACVLVAAPHGAVAIAMAGALSTGVIALAWLLYLPRVMPASPVRMLFFEVLRVLAAALAAFGAVRVLHNPGATSHFLSLLTDVATGGLVFFAVTGLSWLATGRQDGPERAMLALLSRKLRKPASAQGH